MQSVFRRLTFQDNRYVNKAMPRGCLGSCLAFKTFSTFLGWVIKTWVNSEFIMHYLHAFSFMGMLGSPECSNIVRLFQDLAMKLRIPLAEEKPRLVSNQTDLGHPPGYSGRHLISLRKLQVIRELITLAQT